MTFAKFCADHVASLAFAAAAALIAAGIVVVVGGGAAAAVLAVCAVTACAAAALAIGYARRRRFYRDLASTAAALRGSERPSTFQVAALVRRPDFLEGRLAWDALDAAGRAAADEVAALQEQERAYREYIELWIHEVKTPIAASLLLAEQDASPSSGRLKAELARIEGYVEQALYYARSTAVEQDYAIREVALAEVVREVCKKHARYLIDEGAVPRLEVPEGIRVFADEKWLAFVLGQVVTNAAKYGAREISFSAREGCPAAGAASGEAAVPDAVAVPSTVLEVADDGCGIPVADVPRVFDRGFTGQNGREHGSSTGMGLYLAAVLCDRMGLGLSLGSEEGVGTRVLIAFPHDRRRRDAFRVHNLTNP